MSNEQVHAVADRTYELLVGSRSGRLPTPRELSDAVADIREVMPSVHVGSREATQLRYLRARLVIAWAAFTMDPFEAQKMYHDAFNDSHEALRQELVHAWDGDPDAQRCVEARARALAIACQEGYAYLGTEQLESAANAISRAIGMVNDQIQMAEIATCVANALARSGYAQVLVLHANVGPYLGPGSAELTDMAATHATAAIELIQYAAVAVLSAPSVTYAQLVRLFEWLDLVESPTFVLLTFSSPVALEALRHLVSACVFAHEATELAQECIQRLGVDDESRLTEVMATYLGHRAHLLLEFITNNIVNLESKPTEWFNRLVDLRGVFWDRTAEELARRPGVEEAAAWSGITTLTRHLNDLQILAAALHMAGTAERMGSAPEDEVRLAESDPERFWSALVGRWVVSVLALPPVFAEMTDAQVRSAVKKLLGWPDNSEAEEFAEKVVRLARRDPSAMPASTLIGRALALQEHHTLEANAWVAEFDGLVTLLETLLSDHEALDDCVDLCSDLLYTATMDQRFRMPPASEAMATIARRLDLVAPDELRIRTRHGVLRTLWMKANAPADYEEIRDLALATLVRHGSTPDEQNIHDGLVIVESIRFVLGSTRWLRGEANTDELDHSAELLELGGHLQEWADDGRVSSRVREFARNVHQEIERVQAKGGPAPKLRPDEDFEDMLALEPSTLARRVASGALVTTPGQLERLREVLRSAHMRGFPYLTSQNWADLIRPNAAKTLGLSHEDRLGILSNLVNSVPPSGAEAVGIIEACVSVTDLLRDPSYGHEANRLCEVAAARHLAAAIASSGRLPNLPLFLYSRSGILVNEVVNTTEWTARMTSTVAAYATAVWKGDVDLCALLAHQVGEYFRLSARREQANWWYAMYDHWLGRGALHDPRWDEDKALIARDRASNLIDGTYT